MKKSDTNLETIMSLIILILFISSTLALILTGKSTQEKIINQNSIKSNSQYASSYITMTLRQNDEINKIYVKENSNTQENALVIENDVKGVKTLTWIYFDEGFLFEAKTVENKLPDNRKATKIADIDGFYIEKDGHKITYEISYIYNNHPITTEHFVILRSA